MSWLLDPNWVDFFRQNWSWIRLALAGLQSPDFAFQNLSQVVQTYDNFDPLTVGDALGDMVRNMNLNPDLKASYEATFLKKLIPFKRIFVFQENPVRSFQTTKPIQQSQHVQSVPNKLDPGWSNFLFRNIQSIRNLSQLQYMDTTGYKPEFVKSIHQLSLGANAALQNLSLKNLADNLTEPLNQLALQAEQDSDTKKLLVQIFHKKLIPTRPIFGY